MVWLPEEGQGRVIHQHTAVQVSAQARHVLQDRAAGRSREQHIIAPSIKLLHSPAVLKAPLGEELNSQRRDGDCKGKQHTACVCAVALRSLVCLHSKRKAHHKHAP